MFGCMCCCELSAASRVGSREERNLRLSHLHVGVVTRRPGRVPARAQVRRLPTSMSRLALPACSSRHTLKGQRSVREERVGKLVAFAQLGGRWVAVLFQAHAWEEGECWEGGKRKAIIFAPLGAGG